ncbi:hypothetical protein [Rhodovulum kholense]|uniref:Uncharacterized protein n=1 Tax=Rhodovulum kholense TaxID=453584 RepID=A0A8E3AQA0_9RHOB|nr:hypothetical protein [Rhodovulum kholense]PTW44316.1 hypothetical protein C8N38_11750 [Rhodovulum kholense]
MLRAAIFGMALGLLAIVGAAGYAALAACRVELAVLDRWLPQSCPSDADIAAAARLDALRDRNLALTRDIRRAENELAALQCEAASPAPPPAPLPEPEPAPAPDSAGIDPGSWSRGDIRVLDGCWELDSDFRTRDIQTGRITHYTQWEMCFDRQGNGRETMTATNGTTCQGAVSGQFLDLSGAAGGDQRLEVREPGNLRCSDGGYIHQRIITCELAGDGSASCVNFQPETGGRGEVRLRRRTEDQ